VGECHSLRRQGVYVRCANVGVAETVNRIPALLVGAEPEDIGH